MSDTLTLIVPSDWPRETPDCPWQLHDTAGRLRRSGSSGPAGWPAASGDGSRCRLLLAGRQTTVHRVQLPPPPHGERQAVIAAALEDALLAPASQTLFAAGPATADGYRLVGVVARARLTALVERLRELGWTSVAAWPLLLALAPGEALACGGELTVRHADGGIAVAIDADLPAWLALLTAAGTPDIRALDEASIAHWPADGGPPPRLDAAPQWQLPAGTGFLVDELAPPRAPADWLRHFRFPARLGVGFAVAIVLTASLQWAWNAWQIHRLRGEIATLFQQAQPGAALVDPVRQMRRLLDTRQRAAGRLAGDDFLTLAAPLASLPGQALALRRLNYTGGELEVELGRLDAAALPTLESAARQQGLHLVAHPANDGGTLLTISTGAQP